MPDPTRAQLEMIERMANDYALVLVDDAHYPRAVTLTPCSFCPSCGGDWFRPEDGDGGDSFPDCPTCNGDGGIPVTDTPVIVLTDGSTLSDKETA